MTVEGIPLTTVGIPLASLLVSVLALWRAWRSGRESNAEFLHEMRKQWLSVQHDWNICLLVAFGPAHHYADATRDERDAAERLRVSFDDERWYEASLELRGHVRRVTDLIAECGEALVSSRWSVRDLYEVLGADVGRHHRLLRTLAHLSGGTPCDELFVQATEFNAHERNDRILLVAFLVRAEQCRRGDTYAHFVAELARELRGDWRRPLRACCSRLGVGGSFRRLPRGVKYSLWRAAHPKLSSAYLQPDEPIVGGADRSLFRRWYEPRIVQGLRIRLLREKSQGYGLRERETWERLLRAVRMRVVGE